MDLLKSRAGLALGMAALACASAARADDLRSAQALAESGAFLAHAETDAAFARLDAARPDDKQPIPKASVYWENGSASFGQAERDGRLGSGGSTSVMRLGVDRDIGSGTIVGAAASAGFGDVNSGDLSAKTFAQNADIYGRLNRGPVFVKMLFGGSVFDFWSVDRGPEDGRSRASAFGYGFRAGGQIGATLTFDRIRITPTVGLAAYSSTSTAYRERGGENPRSFASRSARAAIGSFRLTGARKVGLAPGHELALEAFIGAEEVLAFKAGALSSTDASGARARLASVGSPNGRGVVGGVGAGTDLAPGVNLSVNYDYGRRDDLATHSSRARLGVHF